MSRGLRKLLARADQRTAIETAARLFPADKAAVEATAVELLSLRIIFDLVEVEPDHGIAWAMPLRLVLIAKGRQRKRGGSRRAGENGCNNRDGLQQISPSHRNRFLAPGCVQAQDSADLIEIKHCR